MEYVTLGETGLRVSRLALGCMSFGSKDWKPWVLGREEGIALVKAAYEAGINFFDTADMYSHGVSEEILGEALEVLNIPRADVVIATKLFFPIPPQEVRERGDDPHPIKANRGGLSRKHIHEACAASLKRLRTSYIDLYQIHRWDNDTPVSETMRALSDLVSAGKVMYLGTSTMHCWQLAKAQAYADKHGLHRFVCMQNLYNATYREEEREMIPMVRDMGMGMIPWSPLARGFLSGKSGGSTRGEFEAKRLENDAWFTADSHKVLEGVKAVADKHKCSAARVAVAWVLSKPFVTAPIIGVSRLEHLEDLVAAVRLRLSDQDIERIERDYKPRNVLGWHQ